MDALGGGQSPEGMAHFHMCWGELRRAPLFTVNSGKDTHVEYAAELGSYFLIPSSSSSS